MSLRDLMARNAVAIMAADGINEPATYHFRSGAPDRSFNVIVRHEQIDPLGPDDRDTATVQMADVFVPVSATAGIETYAEGDEITLSIRYGLPPRRCRIVEELSASPMGFLLRVVA
jgi:hypothetical protein